jgi:hypothetical protein
VEILEEADDDDGGGTCQSYKKEEGEYIGGNSDERVHGLIVSREGGHGGNGRSEMRQASETGEVGAGKEFTV